MKPSPTKYYQRPIVPKLKLTQQVGWQRTKIPLKTDRTTTHWKPIVKQSPRPQSGEKEKPPSVDFWDNLTDKTNYKAQFAKM